MATAGIANVPGLFQELYPEEVIPWLIPENLPFLHLIRKEGGVSGQIVDHPLLYSTGQGYSTDFNRAAAQAGGAPLMANAAIRMSQAYQFLELFDKDQILSQGPAAYADLFETICTGAIKNVFKNLDLDAHIAGNGWRGTVNAVAGQVSPYNSKITLAANQVSVYKAYAPEAVFELNQYIQAATYNGYPVSGSIFPPADGRAATNLSNDVQIVAIDPINYILTLSDASAFTVNSFIVNAGGATGFSSGNLNGGIIGMDAWNPYGGVTSTDSFCSVNRYAFGTRLAGYYLDASANSIEGGIKLLSSRMSQGGAASSTVGLINPADFDQLDSKMTSFSRYSSYDTATFGFNSIIINGAAGRLDMICDPHQPQGYARIIDPSTWVMRHAGGLPHIVDIQGRTVEQGLNFDGRTARIRAYPQIFCEQPHKQGIVKLPQTVSM